MLADLRRLGKESYRNTYRRHGVNGSILGVSTADLKSLQKKIKVDHELAQALWASGAYEARVLATMIADAAKATASQLDAWAKDLDSYPITDAFASFVSRTPHAQKKAEAWLKSKDEWLSSAAWHVVSHLASAASLADSYFEPLLDTIRRNIAKVQNRTRHSMNGTLIAIGGRSAAMAKKAIAIARDIGVVEVDHGDTACKTPAAEDYILKIRARAK